jgi:hypothetical protein
MPIYEYRNPETGETIEVVQKMNDSHIYIDYDGLEWERVWAAPNAGVDCKLDGSMESFMNYTKDKKGTMGDIWDASREASEIRQGKEGKDKVKNRYFKDYSKKRNGLKHQKDDR